MIFIITIIFRILSILTHTHTHTHTHREREESLKEIDSGVYPK